MARHQSRRHRNNRSTYTPTLAVATALLAFTSLACSAIGDSLTDGPALSSEVIESPIETVTESDSTTTTNSSAATPQRRFAVSFADSTELWEVTEQSDRLIDKITLNGSEFQVTDVALLDDGRLMGVSFTDAYIIDPASGEASLIGSMGADSVNALTQADDGQVYAATLEGELLTIDVDSGEAEPVEYNGPAFSSSGDLAPAPGGGLYVTSRGPTDDILFEIDPVTGDGERVAEGLPEEVWGLASDGQNLIGLVSTGGTSCAKGALVKIEIGRPTTEVRCLDFTPAGLTS